VGWKFDTNGREEKCLQLSGCENLKEGDSLKDLNIGKRVIRNLFLKKEDEWLWTGVIWLGVGKIVGCCEQANEIWGSIK
jgi:hypothetical protein